MTTILVLVALIVANIVFTVVDTERTEDEREIENYRRVEYKKSYEVEQETSHSMSAIY